MATASGSTWATLNTDAIIYGLTVAAGHILFRQGQGTDFSHLAGYGKKGRPFRPGRRAGKIDYIPNLQATTRRDLGHPDNLVLDVTMELHRGA